MLPIDHLAREGVLAKLWNFRSITPQRIQESPEFILARAGTESRCGVSNRLLKKPLGVLFQADPTRLGVGRQAGFHFRAEFKQNGHWRTTMRLTRAETKR
jgi:hypothetical protein